MTDTNSRRERYLELMEQHISQHGYFLQCVLGGPDMPFAYTVGLAEKGVRELIVFGLDAQISAQLVYDILASTRQGLDFPQEGCVPWRHDNWPMQLMLCAVTRQAAEPYAFAAINRCPVGAKFVQVVLPDPDGLFPWDSGVKGAAARQPLLSDPSKGAPRSLH